ncbi:MAG: citrate/2-methylcitrate synthase [Clostridia bacterium]|nr:citrate/2-methylcitrate synthase [Clostridia bacterium]
MDTGFNRYIDAILAHHKAMSDIPKHYYSDYNVKRGLRNADGTGVMAGLTGVGEVHGYVLDEGSKAPIEGQLRYRGISIEDIIENCDKEDRFGFEETIFLLMFGELPKREELKEFSAVLANQRTLPEGFAEDMILKAPSSNIMNKLARSVLALYSYDSEGAPDDISMANLLRQSFELIARFPTLVAYAYAAKKHYFDGTSLVLHNPNPELSIAENFLYMTRANHRFTKTEAKVLDKALMLHAEHGGGNNSAFAIRVLSSSNTDTYSAVAAAIGSLKGPKHGGANEKTLKQMREIGSAVKNWEDEQEVYDYLCKIVRKEAGDGSGLIYGIGHAIYTLSDPRAVVLKECAKELSQELGREKEFALYESIERLAPKVFEAEKGITFPMPANVDLYSGFVYQMLGIPEELYTPIFAMARIVGWCAHRIEEVMTGGKIIRPAYKNIMKRREYKSIDER